MSATPGTSAGRFEVKYLLHPEIRTAVRRELELRMDRDAHSINGPYTVRSLYFDSPSLQGFHEKLDGVPHRRKYRIREYGRDAARRVFELKEKTYDRGFKQRVSIDAEACDALMEGRFAWDHECDAAIRAFQADKARRPLHPSAVVSYRRDAFSDRGSMAVRVTIDSGVQAAPVWQFDSPPPNGSDALPVGTSILEIKWDRSFPVFLHDLVRKYSLRNEALSKYCLGVEALMRRGYPGAA